jgi:hypothetical protein
MRPTCINIHIVIIIAITTGTTRPSSPPGHHHQAIITTRPSSPPGVPVTVKPIITTSPQIHRHITTNPSPP